MDDDASVALLHRKLGFGLGPDQLDGARGRGFESELAELLDPSGMVDPWAGVEVPTDPGSAKDARVAVVVAWIEHLCATTTPGVDRMAWMLHGWLVSSMDKVRSPAQMVNQLRTYRAIGFGSFPELLRHVTTDPAMLTYLDGRQSTGGAPNENYARELLELFALGVGAFTEADVKAGARALTGWTVRRGETESAFVPRRHDDTPVTYLGIPGVHDVDTVVAAVAEQPAHASFVAARVAREVLGSDEPEVVAELARAYTDGGRRLDAVIDAAAGIVGRGGSPPAVLGPVPWLVIARRATGATLRPGPMVRGLKAAGQVPLYPPNVAGWPGGPAWFATATVVARANLAADLAAAAPEGHPTLVAAAGTDLDALAHRLGLPEQTFGPSTADALRAVTDPRGRLALALVSPEFVIA